MKSRRCFVQRRAMPHSRDLREFSMAESAEHYGTDIRLRRLSPLNRKAEILC